jgi:hypothetical protein
VRQALSRSQNKLNASHLGGIGTASPIRAARPDDDLRRCRGLNFFPYMLKEAEDTQPNDTLS